MHNPVYATLPLSPSLVLCHDRVNHGRSCRTSSTLQHHSPGGSSDCDLQLHCRLAQVDSWLGQFCTGVAGAMTRRHDIATTKPDPCSESVQPRRGEGLLRRFRRPAVGNTWAGWGSMPVVFFTWDGRSPVSHPTCDVPFPPRRTG
jgi:hypothetical protein